MKTCQFTPEKIVSFEAEGNYTYINLSDGGHYIYAKTLKKFEQEFTEHQNFVRISKSMIINVRFARAINKNFIELKNQSVYKISRRRQKEVFIKFNEQI